MQSLIKYIDKNLKTQITAEELADMAGYSLWHFCRMFAQETGMPVMAYITKRRIDNALMEIANGRKGADVALEYGFDTYAGFYKCFTRMYGCSPRKYLSLYGGYRQKQSGGFNTMEQHELRKVLTNWDIPQNLPLGDIWILDGAAASGNVWKVGENYVLKFGPRDKMLNNMRIVKALAAQGFTAAHILTTKTGEEYIDGDNIFILFHSLPGEPLSKEQRFGESRYDYGYKYGQGIAKLHLALQELEPAIMPDEVNLYKNVTEWALPDMQKQNQQWSLALPEDFFEEYTREFGSIFDKLPKQLIHRDVHPSNILFHNSEISGFIDFDLSERNIRLWDPCYCATGLLCEWRDVEDIQKKWPLVLTGVLSGYGSIAPLTPEEKRAVYYVLCSIEMVVTAYTAGIEEFQELAKTNREMLQYIAKNKAMVDGIFK